MDDPLLPYLEREIARLPRWTFERDRIARWFLNDLFGDRSGDPYMVRVTPVYASGWEGVGSYLCARGAFVGSQAMDSEYGPLHLPDLARKMVDDLIDDPRFRTSTGTPIEQ